MKLLATIVALVFLAPAAFAQAPPVAPAHGITSFPQPIPSTAPQSYPADSFKRGEHGKVRAKLCVSQAGRATSVELVQSSGFDRLDKATLKFLREVKYKPAMSGDKAVAICDYMFDMNWPAPP